MSEISNNTSQTDWDEFWGPLDRTDVPRSIRKYYIGYMLERSGHTTIKAKTETEALDILRDRVGSFQLNYIWPVEED
jgi:hypothetical protein